jgi:hypothetical protein
VPHLQHAAVETKERGTIEQVGLPPGITSRVQLSPYRVVLAE